MSDPARDLRYARWLLERAMASDLRADLWLAACAVSRLGGEYLHDEPALFAQLQAVSDQQLDLWAELKASDR